MLDALIGLFFRSDVSAETLWVGGWLLRQLLPYSVEELSSHHLELLKVRQTVNLILYFVNKDCQSHSLGLLNMFILSCIVLFYGYTFYMDMGSGDSNTPFLKSWTSHPIHTLVTDIIILFKKIDRMTVC